MAESTEGEITPGLLSQLQSRQKSDKPHRAAAPAGAQCTSRGSPSGGNESQGKEPVITQEYLTDCHWFGHPPPKLCFLLHVPVLLPRPFLTQGTLQKGGM